MTIIINKNWRILAQESVHELFLLPYIHLLFLMGVELTVGWLQFSVTLSYFSYSSDKNNEVIEQIRKGGEV